MDTGDGRMMQRQFKSGTKAWTARQPHNDAHGVQVPCISAEPDMLSPSQPCPTPGSWLISGQGIRESFDHGPEDLPELSDEQFAHAYMATGPSQECTASSKNLKCATSKKSAGLCQRAGVNIATSPFKQAYRLRAETMLKPTITAEEDAEVKRDNFVVERDVAAHTIDLAPPAPSDASMHPLSSNGSTIASAGDWMPMFAGMASRTSEKVCVPRASAVMPTTGAGVLPAAASPCSQPLTSSSQTSGGLPRSGQKKRVPCPPLPRRPSFGARASPGHLPLCRSLRFSPDVASPKLGRGPHGSSATQSPQSLPLQGRSRAHTVPLPPAVPSPSHVLDHVLRAGPGVDHLNNPVSPNPTECKAQVVTQCTSSIKKPASCNMSETENHGEEFVVQVWL